MSYVTNAEIEARVGTAAYVALTDDSGTGTADTAKVNEARSGAEGEANSYLATRYQVPVNVAAESEVAAVLKSFVLDLAAYRLHNRRPPVPEDIVRRRGEAVQWFSRVATGVVHLPAALPLAANPALVTGRQMAGSERVMTRETLSDL
jgi:phage gp36-like protein